MLHASSVPGQPYSAPLVSPKVACLARILLRYKVSAHAPQARLIAW